METMISTQLACKASTTHCSKVRPARRADALSEPNR